MIDDDKHKTVIMKVIKDIVTSFWFNSAVLGAGAFTLITFYGMWFWGGVCTGAAALLFMQGIRELDKKANQ